MERWLLFHGYTTMAMKVDNALTKNQPNQGSNFDILK